jgi:hypothetical protein
MVMGRFLINIYPISSFTSIREEQGLNMEVVYPVYHSRKAWCWTNSFHRTMSHAQFYTQMRLMTAVLIDEHVHEKVFNDRIAELLALFVIKESALYFEGLLLYLYISFLFCLLLHQAVLTRFE